MRGPIAALIAIAWLPASCRERPPIVHNVVGPIARVPYAEMLAALCARLDQVWPGSPRELAGYRLEKIDPQPFDAVRDAYQPRTWRVVGARPFVELRELQPHDHVVVSQLRVEHGIARDLCDELHGGTRIAPDLVGGGCTWRDPSSTYRMAVEGENGAIWLGCSFW